MRRLLLSDVAVALGTLAIGGAGAALFAAIGLPAPYLTGPALAVTVATLSGLRLAVPPRLRDALLLVLGVGIGSTVTPEVVRGTLAWPLSLAALAVALVAIVAAGRALLRRRYGFTPLAALLAATPGHLSYVIALSEATGSDTARISLVQSIRVLFLTLVVPAAVAVAGLELPQLEAPETMTLPALAASLAAAALLGLGLGRLAVPAPLLIGGILASALLHGSGILPGRLPAALAALAFIAMGCLIGTRFAGETWAGLRRALGAGMAVTAAASLISVAAALPVAALLGVPPLQTLIAFAPGAIEAMAAMALITGVDPAFVAAHHVGRMLLLTLLVPLLLRRLNPPA